MTRREMRQRRRARRRAVRASVIGVAVAASALLIFAPGKVDKPSQAAEMPEMHILSVTLPEVTTELATSCDTVTTEQTAAETEPPEVYTVTFYCACERCCGKSDGITATGTRATAGRTIAVDPSVIPYGATVYVYYESGEYGEYVAEDCGGAVKGNHIDVFCDSHNEALERGVQTAQVFWEVNNE